MVQRMADGSAGDADYAAIGTAYPRFRRPDPRIAAAIHAALGDARSVVNVGAGTGSYEPRDRLVTPVEPSVAMRAHRPAGLPAAVDATAEALPFPDSSFDAAMAAFTVHQWRDLAAGLREVRRVTTGPIVVLTCDPTLVDRFENQLRRDLHAGAWDDRYGALREQATLEGSLVLVISEP